jgi:hypothetical protein
MLLLAACAMSVGHAGAADTLDAPHRAAGLWELRQVGEGGTVIGLQTLCVDEASEARVNVFGQIATNVNCSKYRVEPTGATWAFEFICGPAEMRTTSQGTVTGDFASSYVVTMTESDGSMTLSRTIEGTRKGACPAGVAPGALMDENGELITNILDQPAFDNIKGSE